MSETTKIQWAEHTGGPFLGCSVVSPGCGRCYAKELAETRLDGIFRRAYKAAGFEDWATRPVWGDKATRVLSKGFWNDVRRINAAHAKAGTVGRWFPSMIDWLDEMPAGIIDQDGKKLEPEEVLARFLKTIHDCQNLIFLLLTKRPENWFDRVHNAARELTNHPHDLKVYGYLQDWKSGKAPANVWIGVSVEDQQRADERIPELLKIPAKVRFLSVEPLLGPVDLSVAFDICDDPQHGQIGDNHACQKTGERVSWVIVGGESGKGARPCYQEWIRSIKLQCSAAEVPCFLKQLGANIASSGITRPGEHWPEPTRKEDTGKGYWRHWLKDPKGGDPGEWPEDLRVREFPK